MQISTVFLAFLAAISLPISQVAAAGRASFMDLTQLKTASPDGVQTFTPGGCGQCETLWINPLSLGF